MLSSFLLSNACGKYVPTFYRLDVRQGNIIEQERVQRLRIGMSRRQVEALLGTPPVADPFNTQRWDYVYLFFPRGSRKKGQQRHLSLFFSGDSLLRIEGDIEGIEIQEIEIEQIAEETAIEDEETAIEDSAGQAEESQ